jgi:hypothetical protein
VLMVFRKVERHRVGPAFETLHGAAHEKNLSYPLTNAMHTMYQDNLYGDAPRGCHHRGNGPDASE